MGTGCKERLEKTQSASIMNRLIYIADPMCSWCHGFSPVLTQVIDHYKDQLPFSMIMGGLRPGGHEPWDQKMKDFLRHHWEEVANKSGQPFSYGLLEQENFKYDTEPSCRAVCVVRDMDADKAFPFFKAIQHAFYYLNNDPNELAFYEPLCEQLAIDKDQFTKLFNSSEYQQRTAADFKQSQNMGIRSFPSLVLAKGESGQMVARGYATFDQVKDRIEIALG